jgi:hypothetical protein
MKYKINLILRENFWAKWSPALRGNASNILTLSPETVYSKKKVGLILYTCGIRIRDERMFGSGSRIKHPGSSTLVQSMPPNVKLRHVGRSRTPIGVRCAHFFHFCHKYCTYRLLKLIVWGAFHEQCTNSG